MPYDNEYNKKLARETDYNNRKYIAHCDTTGQGTINYRVNITSRVGYGAGDGSGEATFLEGESDNESVGTAAGDCGSGGQGILGLQTGSLLGGPKVREISHRMLSSFSSLGAPLSFQGDTTVPRPVNRLANGTSNAGLPAPAAPPGAPAASAPPTDASAANTNPSGPPNPQQDQVGTAAGVVPGLKPFKAPPVPITNSKYSYLTTARQYPSGYQSKAGKIVSVRDLGDVSMAVGSGGHKPCCSGCAHGDSCEDSDSAFSSSDDEERDVKNVIPVRVGGNAFDRPSGAGGHRVTYSILRAEPGDTENEKLVRQNMKELLEFKTIDDLEKIADAFDIDTYHMKYDFKRDKKRNIIRSILGYVLHNDFVHHKGNDGAPPSSKSLIEDEHDDEIDAHQKSNIRKLYGLLDEPFPEGDWLGTGEGKKKNDTLGKMNKLEQEIIEDPVNKTLEKYDDMKTFKKKFKESIKGKSPKELKEFAKQATTIDKKVPENVEKKIDVYVDDKYGDGAGCGCGGTGCGSCGVGTGGKAKFKPGSGKNNRNQQAGKRNQQQQKPQRQQSQQQQQSQKPQMQKKAPPTISKKAPPSIKSKPAPTTKSNNAPDAPTSKPTSSSKNAPPPPPNKPPTKPTKKETPEATPAAPPGKPAPAPAKPPAAPPSAPPAKPGAPPAKPGAPAAPPGAKPGLPAAPATGGPKWITNASKVLDVAAKAIQVVMLGKQAYDLFTKTPVDDFDNYFGDDYGDTSDLTIEELIEMLRAPPNNLSPEEIQDLLKESQGAKKVETGATTGPSAALKVKTAALTGNKGKNKPPKILKEGDKPCPAAENAVADFTEQVPKEALPVRKQDSYFGSGEKPKRGRKPKLLNPNPNIHMAVPQTKGQQTKVVEKAMMQASTMSGMGEDKALLNPNPNIRKAKRATKGQQTKVVEKALMNSSTMSGMGKVAKGKKGDRAAIVKKVMEEKGMKMIEASKYVKENNLY